MTDGAHAKAAAAIACADEIERICDEMIFGEGNVMATLALALGRRIARATGTPAGAALAARFAAVAVESCAGFELIKLATAAGATEERA